MDAVALAVAAALLVVGVAAAAVRRWVMGAVCVGLGVALPVMAYADALDASPSLAPLGLLVAPLAAPLVAWACTRPSAAVRGALLAGFVAGPTRSLLYDPFYDPTCVTVCDPNPLALAHVSASVEATLWLATYVAAGSLALAAVRGPDRVARGVLALAAMVVAVSPALALATTVAAGAVAVAVIGAAVGRVFESRARVADLARALENAADVEIALRSAVDDPGITVSYAIDAESPTVDARGGQARDLLRGQVATELRGPDGLVAQVYHDPTRSDAATLAAAVTGPARLAIENGRLSARVQRQADALSASRRRIVMHADEERRRLERDLHDGAQQHLLALGLTLRTSLERADDPESADIVHRCLASTHVALDELRELSHGFYPASLEQTGLRHALDGVVDRAPFPVSVTALPVHRLPAETERAIYLLVARLAAVAHRPISVSVTCAADEVAVEIVGASGPRGVLTDVFAVLGGTLRSQRVADAIPVVHGVLPLPVPWVSEDS